MTTHEILWPDVESHLVGDIQPYVDVHSFLTRILALTDPTTQGLGPPTNVLLSGHHGLGKSLLAANVTQALSERVGFKVPMITFDCSEDTFELMLIGSSRVVAGGETPFVPGPFPTAIYLANQVGLCVLCVEEISALTPGAQKVFNRMTDWRRGIYVPDVGRMFQLDAGCHVIVIATMNPSGYGGVYNLNEDLSSRFAKIQLPLPTKVQEALILRNVCPFASPDLIDRAIQMAESTRTQAFDTLLSTRDLVGFIRDYKRLEEAAESTTFALELVVNKFEMTNRNIMLDRIDAVFSTQLRATLGRAAAL